MASRVPIASWAVGLHPSLWNYEIIYEVRIEIAMLWKMTPGWMGKHMGTIYPHGPSTSDTGV
jgi:hypothetical protein